MLFVTLSIYMISYHAYHVLSCYSLHLGQGPFWAENHNPVILNPEVFLSMILEVWHIYFWTVSPIFLYKTSQAPSGWMGNIGASVFRSLQSWSITFKSGLWLRHSRTFTELSRSHSFVILAVCLGLSSCWKMNLLPSLRFWIIIINAISINSLMINLNILVHWDFFLLWRVPQSLSLKNSPTAWGCFHHTLLLGWYSAGDEQSWFPSIMMLKWLHNGGGWGDSPFHVKALWVPRKSLYKCNKLL